MKDSLDLHRERTEVEAGWVVLIERQHHRAVRSGRPVAVTAREVRRIVGEAAGDVAPGAGAGAAFCHRWVTRGSDAPLGVPLLERWNPVRTIMVGSWKNANPDARDDCAAYVIQERR